jgi:WhiB family redox-sensing transcriptional regulator
VLSTYPTEELNAEFLFSPGVPVQEPVRRLDEQPSMTVGPILIDPTIDPAFGVNIDGLPCQVLDADLWFAETPAELERAKSYCLGCPVRAGCLSGALDRREPWGVWGGEIFEQGAIIARKRPRGRPRKNAEVAA